MPLFTWSKRSCSNIIMKKDKQFIIQLNPIVMSKINIFFRKRNLFMKKKIEDIKSYKLISPYKRENKRYSNLKNLGSLPRTFLSSLIIISIFSILPTIIEFTKERMLASKDFENKSKNNFEKTLEGKLSSVDTELNKKFVFEDILEFDNMPTDSVRLSALLSFDLLLPCWFSV